MSSAPQTSTYDAGAATLSAVCSWHAFIGRVVGLICPGLGPAKAGTLMPVDWEAMVCVENKEGRCICDTADHAAGGDNGRRGRGSGRQGAKYRSTNQHEGLEYFTTTRPIMPRAGATGDAGGAAKYRSTNQHEGLEYFTRPKLPGRNSRERFFKRRFKIVLECSNR
jgi:hypothetical protein